MRQLIFVGDIHGDLRELVWNLTIRRKITEADIIVAGDFGVGFSGKDREMDYLYSRVNKRLEKYDLVIYVVRGNHDNPSFFDGNHNFYPRLVFLEDYKPIELCEKIILPIGGGISIDQEIRKQKNLEYERFGSKKRLYWSNEDVRRVNIKELPKRVDIIVTHESPISFEPIIVKQDLGIETSLWNRILDSRRYLDTIKDNVNFKYWIHGHYHKSTSGSWNNAIYRGLDIKELFEIYG